MVPLFSGAHHDEIGYLPMNRDRASLFFWVTAIELVLRPVGTVIKGKAVRGRLPSDEREIGWGRCFCDPRSPKSTCPIVGDSDFVVVACNYPKALAAERTGTQRGAHPLARR